MAAPMWRMNGLWKRMAGVLVLCALLLSNEVLCQGDDTSIPTPTTTVPASKATAIPPLSTVTAVGDAAYQSASTATGDGSVPLATGQIQVGDVLGTSGTPAASIRPSVAQDLVRNVTNAVVNPSSSSSSSSGSSVFVGILVSGLLAALAITVGYCKCQRRTDTKGVRLAEEAYPVDQENQGNTLVSVAPLNPPPETQEKPSVNGESPEAAKTQPPPPTNGHSTTKTADTEL